MIWDPWDLLDSWDPWPGGGHAPASARPDDPQMAQRDADGDGNGLAGIQTQGD